MSSKTILDSSQAQKTELDKAHNPQSTSLALTTFRGSKIIEEFEAIGAEADVYLVKKDNRQYFLKLYRRGIKLNGDILGTIQNLSHDYKYFAELFEYGFDESVDRYYELSEYIQHGSLDKVTINRSNVNTLITALNESLSLLHENQIIHRDLKPNNILLRSIDPLNIVLVDFGVSSVIADDMTKVLTTLKGTYAYTAPEVMSGYIGKEVDYFSLGMILLELLDKNPFSGLDGAVVLHTLASTNVDIPNHIDNRLKLLLQGLLTRDPKKRWGYSQVNEWIKNKSPEVHFDTYAEKVDNSKKYKFKDAYYTQKELAKVFTRQENFEDALKHIGRGYITKYLEKLEEFDEAIKLDEEYKTPIEKFIYFIYSQAKELPFSLYGVAIDEDYMFNLLLKYTQNKIDGIDKKIFELFESGDMKRLIKIYEECANTSFSSKKFILTLPTDSKDIYEYLDINKAVTDQDIARVKLLVRYMDNVEQKVLSAAINTENIEIIKLIIAKTKKIEQDLISQVIDNGNIENLKLVLSSTNDINTKNIEKLLFSDYTKYLDKQYIRSLKSKNKIILRLMENDKIDTIKSYFNTYDLHKTIYKQIDNALDHSEFDELLLKFFNNFNIDVDIKNKTDLSLLDLATKKKDINLVEFLSCYSKNNTINYELFNLIIKNDKIELYKKYEPFKKSNNEILHQAVEEKSDNIATYLIGKIGKFENRLLLLAINTGQLDIVRLLVENGFIFEQNDKEQELFVLNAFIYNRQEIAEYLIRKGTNVNIKDNSGSTLLHLAMQKNWNCLFKDILDKINLEYLNAENWNGQTVLDIAIEKEDIELVELLLKYIILSKINTNFIDFILDNDHLELYKKHENLIKNQNEILYQAIKDTRKNIATYLIQKVENIDNILLFLAITTDQLDIVKALTKRGVDLESKGKYGDSPVLYAFQTKRIAIVKFLIEQKVNLTNKDKYGNTLLILTIHNDWDSLAKILIASEHIDINENNHIGNTALFYAVKKNNYTIASFLLTKGADVTVTNKQGETPLHFYLKQSRIFSTSTIKELLEHGIHLYDKDKSGRTVQDLARKNAKQYLDIFDAIKRNDMGRIKLLINSGESVDQKNKDGKTPLILALKHKKEDMVEFLIDKGADKNYAFHWLVNEVAYSKGIQ